MNLQKYPKLSIALTTLSSLAISTSAFADEDICGNKNVPQHVQDAAGCGGNAGELPVVVINILNAIIGAAGIVAVIFIVYGGIQYMTSSGEATKAKKARDTILYACIGLIICVLAFAIVNWVIGILLSHHAASEMQ